MAVVNLGSSNIVNYMMQVGRKIKITRPLGYPPAIDPSVESVYGTTEANGFKLLDTNLGKFVDESDAGDDSVIYEHIKSGQQIIRYSGKSLVTVLFYVVAQSVLVHDHASIAMGGPAYATYFTEKPTKDKVKV